MQTKHIQTIISLFFAAILVFSNGIGLPPQETNSQALVRIDLHQQSDIDLLAASHIPIQARLYDAAGKLSALALIDSAQRSILEQRNIPVRTLDENPKGKDYFLVRLNTPNASPRLETFSIVLDTIGDQAVVSVRPEQAEAFFRLGFDLQDVNKDPLPYPQESAFFAPAFSLEPNPAIAQMLVQVSESDVYDVDGSLSGKQPVTVGGDPYTILTRHSGNATASEMVTQYTYEQFDAMGLSVAYHNYNHPYYGSRRNVVAEQPGIGQPDRIYLITAHIDDMPSGDIAPGADDNASGSTAVLLAAEVLSQYDFDFTLRYVLFTGEEQGLYGSYYYAQDAANAGDEIEAVLNLDMIAYNSDSQPILDLHIRPENGNDLYIANTFANVIEAYDLNLNADIHQDGMGYSDHDSFWSFNYPAILAIEDDDDFTPYYHTVDDTLSTLDLTYFTDFVKASIATFAHLGSLVVPSNGTIRGSVTEIDGSTFIVGATLEASQGGTVINSTISDIDGNYLLHLPVGAYTVTANHPDFIPQNNSNISVTTNTTTTLDFSLEAGTPIAGLDFTFYPEEITVGQTVTFTGTVISGTLPITYTWDFGNENAGRGAVITHTFPITYTLQTYTATLTADNIYNQPQSVEKIVSVWPHQLFLPTVLKSNP